MEKFLQMLFFALLATVAVVSVVFVLPAFHKYSTIKERRQEARAAFKRQVNECLVLRHKLSNIEKNTTEIEKMAREKFNYCKEGETIYKFKEEKTK